MTYRINLNADIGEGFGAYDIGNDADLMTVIRSASVACGFHAGDASTMHSLTLLAQQNNVSLACIPVSTTCGLWPAQDRDGRQGPRADGRLPDRRPAGDGALCRPAGHAPQAPWGAEQHGGGARGLCAGDRAAIQTVDDRIIYVALAGSQMEKAARSSGSGWRAKASPTATTRTTAISARAPFRARSSRTPTRR